MCPPNPVAREVGVGASRCWGQGRWTGSRRVALPQSQEARKDPEPGGLILLI